MLSICGLAGDLICAVESSSLERVHDLKAEIYRASKISPKLQKLLLGGSILNNTDRLQEVLNQHSDAAEIQLIRTDKWAEEVERDWHRLRKASHAVRNDPELVAAAIDSSRGEAIKYAGEDVRADREMMLAAMKFDHSLCRYVRGSLLSDRDFLLAALKHRGLVRRYGACFQWQSNAELCADYDFLLQVLAEDGVSFHVVSEELRSNERLARVAVESCPSAFRYAGEDLRSDEALAALAARLDPLNLEFVAKNFRADRSFVLRALESEPIKQVSPRYGASILKHLSEELRSDVDVVSKALAYMPAYAINRELDHISSELKNHPEIQKLNPWGSRGYQQPVRSRPATGKRRPAEEVQQWELPLSQEARTLLMHADEATQHQPSFWLQLVKLDPEALRVLGSQARDDKHVVMTAVRKSGTALEYAGEKLRGDLEVVKLALKESRWAYDFIPEAMRLQKEVAILAFRLHQIALPKQLLNDKDTVVAAAEIAAGRAENPVETNKKKLNKMSIATLIAEYQLA